LTKLGRVSEARQSWLQKPWPMHQSSRVRATPSMVYRNAGGRPLGDVVEVMDPLSLTYTSVVGLLAGVPRGVFSLRPCLLTAAGAGTGGSTKNSCWGCPLCRAS
jgi:hypothetical protein